MNRYDRQHAEQRFAARLAFTTGAHELDHLVRQNRPEGELTKQCYKVVGVEGGWERWQTRGYRSETATRVA